MCACVRVWADVQYYAPAHFVCICVSKFVHACACVHAWACLHACGDARFPGVRETGVCE